MRETITYAALIRIAAWSIFFLLILSAVLPHAPIELRYQEEMHKQNIDPVITYWADPRFVRPDTLQTPQGVKNIIWVAGSSVLIPPEEFPEEGEEEIYDHVPARVQRVLEENYEINSRAQLSMLLARRALDTYTMTLDALNRNPDMLVITLNPFWELNEQSVYLKRELFNAGLPLWIQNQDWPLITLAAPGHIFWNIIGRYIPVIRDAHDRLKQLEEHIELPDLKLKPKDVKLFADFEYDQPLTFWIVHRFLGGQADQMQLQPGKFDAKVWQLLNLQSARMDSEKGWADYYMNKTLQTIQNNGVPALIYLAPISEDITFQDAAYAKYAELYERINQLQKQYSKDNIRIITSLPREVEFSLSHVDFLHLDHPGNLPDFIAGEIATMIEAQE